MINQNRRYLLLSALSISLIFVIFIILIISIPGLSTGIYPVIEKNSTHWTYRTVGEVKTIEIGEYNFDAYPKITWNEFNLSYSYENCGLLGRYKIEKNFDIFEDNTNFTFYEVEGLSKVNIKCIETIDSGDPLKKIKGQSFYSIGEDQKGVYINRANITIVKGFYTFCKTHSTEMHELLHAFDFDHTGQVGSIMHFQTEVGSCLEVEQPIWDKINQLSKDLQ